MSTHICLYEHIYANIYIYIYTYMSKFGTLHIERHVLFLLGKGRHPKKVCWSNDVMHIAQKTFYKGDISYISYKCIFSQ